MIPMASFFLAWLNDRLMRLVFISFCFQEEQNEGISAVSHFQWPCYVCCL